MQTSTSEALFPCVNLVSAHWVSLAQSLPPPLAFCTPLTSLGPPSVHSAPAASPVCLPVHVQLIPSANSHRLALLAANTLRVPTSHSRALGPVLPAYQGHMLGPPCWLFSSLTRAPHGPPALQCPSNDQEHTHFFCSLLKLPRPQSVLPRHLRRVRACPLRKLFWLPPNQPLLPCCLSSNLDRTLKLTVSPQESLCLKRLELGGVETITPLC